MDTMYGVLILVGFLGVGFLWQKLVGSATSKVNQKVMTKTHKRGKELVSRTHEYRAKATPLEVKNAILNHVQPVESAPALKGAVTVDQSQETGLAFVYGNKLNRTFRFTITFVPHDGNTIGRFSVSDWVLANGLIASQKEMVQMMADVEAALKSVDPGASVWVIDED